MRIKINKTYSDLKVWSDYIWGDVAAITSLNIQVNGLLGYYMIPNLFATISANPYMAPSDPGTNTIYNLGTTIIARKKLGM